MLEASGFEARALRRSMEALWKGGGRILNPVTNMSDVGAFIIKGFAAPLLYNESKEP